MKRLIPTMSLLAFASGAALAGDIEPLGGQFQLADDTSYEQKQPWVAADDAGNFVVSFSWLKNVYYRLFDRDGNPLGVELLANPTINMGEQDETYIAMDPVSGDFVIGWSDRHGNDGFNMGCGGRFFRADGVPYSPEQILNTHTDLSQFEPHLAFMPNGTVMGGWADAGTDGSVGCIGRLFDRTGAPLSGEFLINEANPKTQIDPSISSSRNGMFVSAYVDAGSQFGEPRDVLARLFDQNATPLGPEFVVNTTTDGMQRDPIVAMDADGDFVVVWQDESALDGSGFGVFARMFDSLGAPKGDEFQVNIATAGDQRDPHVVCDYMGNFVVTWEDASGGDFDVKIRRYARDGAPLSGEIVVHTLSAGDQLYAKSALSHNGQRLVTVWYDDLLDDAFGRVYGLETITPDKAANLGVTVNLAVDLPGMGGAPYLLLPSLADSPGFPVAGGRTLGLVPDALFFLGVAMPSGGIFNGLVGVLDPSGAAAASVTIPNDPAALGIDLHFAAFTLNVAGDDVDYFTDTLVMTIE